MPRDGKGAGREGAVADCCFEKVEGAMKAVILRGGIAGKEGKAGFVFVGRKIQSYFGN